jgi:hypothetical protein
MSKQLHSAAGRAWCRLMHPSAMCWRCQFRESSIRFHGHHQPDPGKIGTNRAFKAESSVSLPMDGGGMLMIQPEWTVAKPFGVEVT